MMVKGAFQGTGVPKTLIYQLIFIKFLAFSDRYDHYLAASCFHKLYNLVHFEKAQFVQRVCLCQPVEIFYHIHQVISLLVMEEFHIHAAQKRQTGYYRVNRLRYLIVIQ